ncbi:MAG TPA: response regulator [Actinomycetota bacterium]|nr:response regulator [Actinomycetota bacterium]
MLQSHPGDHPNVAASGERPTVVVVDDVAETRELLRFLLQDDGIHVIGEAGTGEQAVDVVRRLRPDVVLMDVMMPELDGLEATRKIKEAAPETQVVILSYNDDRKLRERAFAAGAFDYFVKDQSTLGLSGAVRDAWDAGRVRRLAD